MPRGHILVLSNHNSKKINLISKGTKQNGVHMGFTLRPRANDPWFLIRSVVIKALMGYEVAVSTHLHPVIGIFRYAPGFSPSGWLSAGHFPICKSSHLHICTFAHLHICTSSHLHIYTSSHLHICTSSPFDRLRASICTFAHLHICTFPPFTAEQPIEHAVFQSLFQF